MPQDLAEQWDTQVQAALARIPAMLVDFPQVPITERQRLPGVCAVYLALKGHDAVLYVGETHNLRERWKQHQRWRVLCDAGATHIAWLPQEDIWIARKIERHCIYHYAPRFNDRGKKYYTGGEHTLRLTRDELALVQAFAVQLSQNDASRDYGAADALRIAALRYLRGTLFPLQGEGRSAP